jgi:hypothetical protein
MRRVQRMIFAFLGTGAIIYFSYNFVCLLLDPYNVVWNREVMDRAAFILEQFRYHKTEDLRQAPDVYDTIVFGNSRAFDSKTSLLDEMMGRRVFNYSTSSDYPLGYLMKLRWLMNSQTRLKEVILEVWYDQFQMTGTNFDVLLGREHPAVSGEHWINYYWAFSELPFETVRNVLLHHSKVLLGLPHDKTIVRHNAFEPGSGDFILHRWNTNPDEEKSARKAYQERHAADKSGTIHFRTSSLTPAEQEFRARAFAGIPLQKIQMTSFIESIDLLKSSNIRYQCVVPPMNARTVSWVPREKYVQWLRFILDACGEVWDFSLPNSITNDNFNYLDWSHFVGDVGYLTLVKVLGGSTAELKDHPDFGRLLVRSDSDRYATLLDAAMLRQQ